MSHTRGFARGRTRARGPRRGFTLIELLVVMAVISILAALFMPSIARVFSSTKITSCLNNLRQIGQAYVSYTTDWDSWLVCAGNRDNEHDKTSPILERQWINDWKEDYNFPYWYEALQPYVNSYANQKNALLEYQQAHGGAGTPSRNDLRLIIARLCGIYSCPRKPAAEIGYGYNYLAPFGNPSCYPNPLSPYKWYAAVQKKWYSYPVDPDGKIYVIPILWYSRSVHVGVITAPSRQLALCDTGLVSNDSNMAAPTDPREWKEKATGSYLGYTRFPVSAAQFTAAGLRYWLRPWRPVPRHGGRTGTLFFDGHVASIPVLDIAGYKWGEPKCIYDNAPGTKPPVSPLDRAFVFPF